MSEVLYPWGYGMSLVIEERLWELARFDLMDPESAERFQAIIVSRGGEMGIGGAVRFVQPDKDGFAPDGKSFHQLQTWSDKKKNYAALDIVMRNGNNVHRAPRWDEVPKQGSGHPDIKDYGVHANVPGEPWHIQPIEIDGWATWVNNGRKRPNPNFPIKNKTKPSVPTPTPQPSPAPPKVYAPGDRTLKVTKPQMNGIDVAFVQTVVRDKAGQKIDKLDGYYGPQTEAAVKNVQAWFQLKATGVVDTATWKLLIQLSKPPAASHQYAPGSRYLKLTSPSMKGDDVLWVQNLIKKLGVSVSVDGVYGRQTRDKVKIVQGWNGLKQDGEVGPKTWAVLKQY